MVHRGTQPWAFILVCGMHNMFFIHVLFVEVSLDRRWGRDRGMTCSKGPQGRIKPRAAAARTQLCTLDTALYIGHSSVHWAPWVCDWHSLPVESVNFFGWIAHLCLFFNSCDTHCPPAAPGGDGGGVQFQQPKAWSIQVVSWTAGPDKLVNLFYITKCEKYLCVLSYTE